ncbi:tetratricopeptide repeat protein [Novipirellula galeiformis]|nr:tetratricopeptide repeat protein [Novipirellula galeiformis]
MTIQSSFSLPILFLLGTSVLVAQDDSEPAVASEPAITAEIQKSHPAQATIGEALQQYGRGNAEQALKLLVAAHKSHPDLAPGEVIFAQLAFATNQPVAGRKALEMAAIHHADDPELWNILADLALRGGRLAESEVLFQHALQVAEGYSDNEARRAKQSINAQAGLASIYERRQQWTSAEEHLRKWIDLAPKNSQAWQRLAGVFFKTQQYDIAEQTLVNLSSFDKAQPIPEVAMGLMYQQAGQHEKAEQAMRSALEKDAEGFTTQLSVARWALSAGDQETLQNCAAKAKELNPESPAVDALLGMAQRFAGNPAQAEAIFSEMLDKNPASFDATNGLAMALLEQDDEPKHHKALQHAQMLVKSNPDQRTTRGRAAAATYAWALFRLNQSEAAAKVINSVITSGEISPETSYFAAAIANQNGEPQLAQELLKGALSSHIAFAQKAAAEELLFEISNQGPDSDKKD